MKLHDHNCGFKCYRRDVVGEISLYGELHRFIPVLAHARGYRVTEIVVHHRPRIHGRTKYGVKRFVKGFLDLMTVRFLTRFGRRPAHVLGSIGLVATAVGGLGLTCLAIEWLQGNRPIGNRPLLSYSVLAVLVGMQMLSLGFLAELFTAHSAQHQADYSVAERTTNPTRTDDTPRHNPDADSLP